MSRFSKRDLSLAVKAKRGRANYSLRIITEARRNNVPISLAFAIVEQESNFRNVFGHDPTSSIPQSWKGSRVTKTKYKTYKSRRAGHGAQGVGPMQLTWPGFQDEADKLGGCWRPKYNIMVGMEHLGKLLKANTSTQKAVAAYNGSGQAAINYAHAVALRQARWHERLA